MKRILIGILACLFVASSAMAADLSAPSAVTYTDVEKNLNVTNDEFRDQINNAVSEMTKTDGHATTNTLQLIINEVNERTQLDIADIAIVASSNVVHSGVATLTGFIVQLASIGGANNGTNTITFANGEKGRMYIVTNVGTSNNLAVALTGNYDGTALDLSPADSALVWFVDTNSIYGIETK